MGIKVEFDHNLSMHELAAAIDRVEQELRAAEPMARTVYIEPDIARPSVS